MTTPKTNPYTLVRGPTVVPVRQFWGKPYRAVAKVQYEDGQPFNIHKHRATFDEALEAVVVELKRVYGIEVIDPDSYHCGLRFQINAYGSDDPEYDSCGEPAVGCSLDDERPGRCAPHLPNFMYLESWGYLPQPVEVIELLDRPLLISHKDDY